MGPVQKMFVITLHVSHRVDHSLIKLNHTVTGRIKGCNHAGKAQNCSMVTEGFSGNVSNRYS